jgi:LPXTG-motif cell wall-anchored protein
VDAEDDGNTGTWVAVIGGLVVLLTAGLGVVIWRRRPG